MNQHVRLTESLILAIGEQARDECKAHGCKHAIDASHPGAILNADGTVRDEIAWFSTFVILIPPGGEDLRDTIAMNLGDERCKWAYMPDQSEAIKAVVAGAKRMWTDEVARMDDIPDPGPVKLFETGFGELDRHGLRLVTPAFVPIVGPYGSGKSIFLRQLLINLWRLHGWRFLLTSFEEKVKPRFQRDLRRHLIAKREDSWTDEDVAHADIELQNACVFFRRKRNTVLDADRLINRIEYAVRVYGVKVVAIDPVNEIDHQVPRGMAKTDYIGHFIMQLKQMADDHNLLVICALHPPKDGVEKRLQKNGLLTLNDGADSANWGNKADIGFCMWRDLKGPTLLHIDKVKDHETMGKPTLCEMHHDAVFNRFAVGRIGYHILGDQE
jgi:archaellum biogenesis ATPase FlaH